MRVVKNFRRKDDRMNLLYRLYSFHWLIYIKVRILGVVGIAGIFPKIKGHSNSQQICELMKVAALLLDPGGN